ncbi:NAD-dependent protein deacetylase of SIR2 family [Streptomyces asoensis]|uniref:NAD-dependent protein deacetylase of SIR2 family n=1 Tax=Streptomyces TaxID=1883 RepID=UPI00190CE9E9|nr:NAD-dependent protein deacetylase of SIR2 family [Streptomyces sp. MBT97]MBK3632165.1 NAD-dependent protein deacetylase of SIR2 family [Streptomyces sp. MBT97]
MNTVNRPTGPPPATETSAAAAAPAEAGAGPAGPASGHAGPANPAARGIPAQATAPVRDTLRSWLDGADRVLIGAGAGLSAAAGYDYGDAERFRELLPALHRLGLRSRYLLGAPLPKDMMWGYWAVHIDDIRYGTEPDPLYRRLRELVGGRDHQVITSNVDALFTRNGFEADRVFTPQGDYGRLQCTVPCTRDTWSSRPFLDTVLAAYDRDTGRVNDPRALPRCPRCGADAFPNIRVGPEFVDDAYLPTGQRVRRWLDDASTAGSLLVVEIGAGFNTPGVIRRPMENVVRRTPGARLVRINPDHADVPADLGTRALSVPLGAEAALGELAL